MKLRVDRIDQEITPKALTKLFEPFGTVEEVAIFAGGDLVYGIIEMPEPDAERAIDLDDMPWPEWNGRVLAMEIANRSRKPWLWPTWRPPQFGAAIRPRGKK